MLFLLSFACMSMVDFIMFSQVHWLFCFFCFLLPIDISTYLFHLGCLFHSDFHEIFTNYGISPFLISYAANICFQFIFENLDIGFFLAVYFLLFIVEKSNIKKQREEYPMYSLPSFTPQIILKQIPDIISFHPQVFPHVSLKIKPFKKQL